MPRISDQFTDIAVYLYQSQSHAEQGADIGGSGFLIGVPTGDPNRFWILAVTNRHVIEDGAPCIRINNKSGGTALFDITERDWIFHAEGQDLAVAPITVNNAYQRYRFVALDDCITKDKAQELGVGVGTDTFLVGRFIGRDGGQTNVPTARFGHIAQMPTLIQPTRGVPQESYLVETRSIGGYSGSPVMAYRKPFELNPENGLVEQAYWGPALLGVDWGHAGQADCVFDSSGRELQMYVESNTGLSFVIPAWRLYELAISDVVRERIESRRIPQLTVEADFSIPHALRLWNS